MSQQMRAMEREEQASASGDDLEDEAIEFELIARVTDMSDIAYQPECRVECESALF